MREIKISIEKNRAKITGDFPLTIVNNALSYTVKGGYFSPRFKNTRWDGKYRFLTRPSNTFPAGLVSIVEIALHKWAEENGKQISIEIIDKRVQPEVNGNSFDLMNGVELRDYQTVASQAMVDCKRGVLKAATNAGKTYIFAAVCKYLHLPAVLIVPRKELLYQAKDDLEKCLGWNVGIIGDGKWKPDFITVAMWHTLSSWLFSKKKDDNTKEKKKQAKKFLKERQMFCVDECHVAGAKVLYRILNSCPAFFRYAMSGTPLDRTDGADLKIIAQTGPVLYEITNRELVELGFSLPAQIQFIRINEPTIPSNCDYRTTYCAGITDNVVRNNKIADVVFKFLSKGLQSIVMVQYHDHADNLMELFGSRKDIVCITGKDPIEVRLDAIRRYKKGNIKVLVTTKILELGVSIDEIDVLVNGAGGKSTISTLQRLGRGLRVGGKSDKLFLVDFADMTHAYLTKHSLARLHDYKNEDCFQIRAV